VDEKEKTAYHEGGHCFRAWRANFLATLDTCLKQDAAGDWWGNTPVRRPRFTHVERAQIALAGLLAEAKAVASEDGVIRNLASFDVLAGQIAQLFGDEAIQVAGPGFELEEDNVWELAVPLAGDGEQVANVTLSDLVEVPAEQRGQPEIKAALDHLVVFINDPIHWAAVDAIAKGLLHLSGGCLGHFMIYCIIRTATGGLIEADE
jgi:hypothetical protein